jgi:prolyl oligopeptidase
VRNSIILNVSFLWNAALVLGACGAPSSSIKEPVASPPSAATAAPAAPRKVNGPGLAAKKPLVREYLGTKVTDDYAWLEDDKDPETVAFTKLQSDYARAHLDALGDRAKLKERIAALKKTSASDFFALRHEAGSLFGLEDDGVKQQDTLVVLGTEGDPKSARTILDPNVLDKEGHTTIDWFVPSPDKKLIAVSLSKNGTESGDVHVLDVATGKEKGEVVTRVHGGTAGGSLAWNADGSGYWYTRYPRVGERSAEDQDFYQQVWFHKLGTPESADTYAIGKEFPRIAEVELDRSDDGKTVLAIVGNGDGGEYEHHVVSGGKWTRLTRFEDLVTTAVFAPDGKIYAISRKEALRGKVIAFAPPFDKPAVDVVPESDGVVENVVVTKSALYSIELVGGPSRVRRIPLGGKPEPLAREAPKPAAKTAAAKKKPATPPAKPEPPVTIQPGERGVAAAEIPLPPVASVRSALRVGDDLLFRIESFTEAPAWYRYRASEHRLVKTALAKKVPFETNDVDVLRETCTSKDGTKVPMSILVKRGRPKDGNAPALVTGYGGFGVSRKPRLSTWYRAWLDDGGIVVETNLRGGGELGEAWHRAGMLLAKQNVFDDFAACAQAVVDLGWTKPARLAAYGRSNGGLLMGAALTQHPELFRAVVAQVGIYDMLRSEFTTNGQFNVTEYGSVKDDKQLKALLAYSPLHNVKDGVAYPAVLFMTGANDPRVDPFHSRKMVARLQAATSSDRPILLRTSESTGHGSGTPLSAEIEETADMLAFLYKELGVAAR